MTREERINLIMQIFKGLDYIHKKGILHRDISLKNVLIKKYDGLKVIKLSDFGLVKIKKSDLTSLNTKFKGSLNDPKLDMYGGFSNYRIEHETFALTRLIYYIMTGRQRIKEKKGTLLGDFVRKGLSDKTEERFNSIDEMRIAFKKMLKQQK